MSRHALGKKLGVAGLTIRRWEEGTALPQKGLRPVILAETGLRYSDFVAFAEEQEAA